MTSDNGTQVGTTMKYSPYGSTRTGSVPTDIKFTGQRLDDTGLYYYGARYYDTEIGRFISPDAMVQNPADPQTLNRYSYVLNNPLKYTDPSGRMIAGYDPPPPPVIVDPLPPGQRGGDAPSLPIGPSPTHYILSLAFGEDSVWHP